MIRLLKFLLAAAAAGFAAPVGALPTVVYSNDFETVSPGLAGWTLASANDPIYSLPTRGPLPTISQTPDPQAARSFLGQFGGDDRVTLTLSLGAFAPAPAVRVDFDVYFIRTWDGEDSSTASGYTTSSISGPTVQVALGPDYFGVEANGTRLFEETFSLSAANQSYCAGSGSPCAPGTGGSEWRTLGYTIPPFIYTDGGDPIAADMVVPLTLYAAYPQSQTLALTFYSRGLQVRPTAYDATPGSWQGQGNLILDESWGLDNVSVTLVPEPQTYVLLALGLGILAMVSRRRRAR